MARTLWPKAQGDLFFQHVTSITKEISGMIPVEDSFVLHVGEGKNHAHVLVGRCGVKPSRSYESGVKTWTIIVPEGGIKVEHRNVKTGKLTGGHGTIELRPGGYTVSTQRSYHPDKFAERVTD